MKEIKLRKMYNSTGIKYDAIIENMGRILKGKDILAMAADTSVSLINLKAKSIDRGRDSAVHAISATIFSFDNIGYLFDFNMQDYHYLYEDALCRTVKLFRQLINDDQINRDMMRTIWNLNDFTFFTVQDIIGIAYDSHILTLEEYDIIDDWINLNIQSYIKTLMNMIVMYDDEIDDIERTGHSKAFDDLLDSMTDVVIAINILMKNYNIDMNILSSYLEQLFSKYRQSINDGSLKKMICKNEIPHITDKMAEKYIYD